MKKYLIGFILGAIIFASISVYAVIKIQADEIGYNDTTVDQALNDLYTTANKEILNNLTVNLVAEVYSTRYSNAVIYLTDNSIYKNYKYFKINSITPSAASGNTSSMCKATAMSSDSGSEYDLSINTEYEVYSSTDGYRFRSIYSRTASANDGKRAGCTVNITFYN